ncbi:hypothetical protein [Desulfoscipio gibsoniae]|nr:hypothetical protein [Desulfoscipio gibsoniae]
MLISKLKKVLKNSQNFFNRTGAEPQTDIAAIKIDDVLVTMARHVSSSVPHEFSVFVPRVEIRKRYYRNNQLQYEKEMIFNSLTIVHSPQHPPVESGRSPIMCQKVD